MRSLAASKITALVAVSVLFFSTYVFLTTFPIVERGISEYEGFITVSTDEFVNSLQHSSIVVRTSDTANTTTLLGSMVLTFRADSKSCNLSILSLLYWVNYNDDWVLSTNTHATLQSPEISSAWNTTEEYTGGSIMQHPQIRESVGFSTTHIQNYTLVLRWAITLHFYNVIPYDYLVNYSVFVTTPTTEIAPQSTETTSSYLVMSGIGISLIVFVHLAEWRLSASENE